MPQTTARDAVQDGPPASARSSAKRALDAAVVNIELTLISIIQGLALGVLAAASVEPLVQLQWQAWPYVLTGLLVVLIFWSRALVHTLSFIGWPLEFGHTFVYFGATLLEAVALSQVAHPERWFALNTLYALAVWGCMPTTRGWCARMPPTSAPPTNKPCWPTSCTTSGSTSSS